MNKTRIVTVHTYCTEYFVPMAVHTTKLDHTHICLNVPQSYCVICDIKSKQIYQCLLSLYFIFLYKIYFILKNLRLFSLYLWMQKATCWDLLGEISVHWQQFHGQQNATMLNSGLMYNCFSFATYRGTTLKLIFMTLT